MIKRILPFLIVIFLAFNVWATDPFFDEIFSGGEGVSCSVSNDSEQWAPFDQGDTNYAQSAWLANKSIIGSQITVTGYLVDTSDVGGSGTVRMVIMDHDSGNDQPDETSEVADSSVKIGRAHV